MDYTTGYGSFQLLCELPADVYEKFQYCIGCRPYGDITMWNDEGEYILDIAYNDKYHDLDVYDALEAIRPFVVSGSIRFTDGESFWRISYDSVTGKFYREDGTVVYNAKEALEVAQNELAKLEEARRVRCEYKVEEE